MKNNILRQAALLVAAVLLTTNFWSCSKDDDPNPDPDPTPTAIAVTGVTLNKTGITLEVDGSETLTATIAVTGVTLNKTELTLEVDGSETLTATVAPDDATNKEVTWSSDKPEIVTVDEDRHMQGCRQGSGHRRGLLV